ncbi:MAG: hypothetical protein SYNGOMJ08_00502 [Candidatus Syntrophoarchaeum sp. GoM_oil]|nr:MAG: hypothetical protein SYNGOMJ08_00502 [Candidatus Syntrophoarchaeum sp. GoM_oil]
MSEDDKVIEKKPPISLEGWVTLLSGEINTWRTIYNTLEVMFVSVLMVLLAVTVSITLTFDSSDITLNSPDNWIEVALYLIVLVLYLFLVVWFLWRGKSSKKKLKPLEEIRDEILSDTLTDHKKIHARYNGAREKK